MTCLAVLSSSMDEIMKMYGGIFSIQIHWEVMNNFEFRDEPKKLGLKRLYQILGYYLLTKQPVSFRRIVTSKRVCLGTRDGAGEV